MVVKAILAICWVPPPTKLEIRWPELRGGRGRASERASGIGAEIAEQAVGRRISGGHVKGRIGRLEQQLLMAV